MTTKIKDVLQSLGDCLFVVGNSEAHNMNSFGDPVRGLSTDILCVLKLDSSNTAQINQNIRIDEAIKEGEYEFRLQPNEKIERNLVLIGSQKSNTIVDYLFKTHRFPFYFKDTLHLIANETEYDNTKGNVGLILAFDSTFNRQKKLLIIAGMHRIGTLACILALQKCREDIQNSNAVIVEGIVENGLVTDVRILEKTYFDEKEILRPGVTKPDGFIKSKGIKAKVFDKVMELLATLNSTGFEGKSIEVAYIIGDANRLKKYIKTNHPWDGLPKGTIFNGDTLGLKQFSGQFDFMAFDTEGKWIDSGMSDCLEVSGHSNYLLSQKLNPYINLTKDADCIVLALGKLKSKAIKFLAEGEQLFEYRDAIWHARSTSEIDSHLHLLSDKAKVSLEVLRRIIKIALLLSDERMGTIFLLGDADEVMKKSAATKSMPHDLNVLKISEDSLMKMCSGEYANVIGSNGILIDTNRELRPSPGIEITVPGLGSRHKMAASITRETNAIGIVVSETGPITVFINGTESLHLD